MKYILLIIFSSLFSSNTNAQKYDNSWMFGYGAGGSLTDSFAQTKTNFLTNPVTLDSLERDFYLYFTNTSLSDPTTGELQFYTNGISVRDKTHSIMQNGDSINYGTNTWINTRVGGYRALWGALALPYPNHPNQYYLVHQRLKSGVPGFGSMALDFMYTKIDMTLNNGKGRVIVKNQSMLHDSLGSMLSATKHANGRDWWIIQQAIRQNKYYFFLLDPTGLHLDHIQNIGPANYLTYAGEGGFFSPDGSRFAFFDPQTGIYIYDFDRCAGILRNRQVVPYNPNTSAAGGFCSICFSPNSQYLYFSQLYHLSQYDLNAANITASKDTVAIYDGFIQGNAQTNFLSMQNAPNGKIYIAGLGGTSYLHIIDEPNIRGVGCHVIQHGLKLRGYNSNSMPNFPNYRLGTLVGSSCDSLTQSISEEGVKGLGLRIYPNPVRSELILEYADFSNKQIIITDVLGRIEKTLSLQGETTSINLSSLSNGIYYVSLYDENQLIDSRKFVVQQE